MRTQQYMQVESIVVKYETLASNTEAVKKTENSFTDFFVPNDCMRLMFMDQLIGRIYQLRAGISANPDVVKEYSEAASFYIKGLLLEDEEQFLVDNFDSFVDYAFDHSNTVVTLGQRFDKPSEWSCLVPYLLDHSSRKVFIAHSDDGREFVGLKDCDLTVEGGFENAAIRALACSQSIHAYKEQNSVQFWGDLEDGLFDAVVIDVSSGLGDRLSLEECFNACCRIVRNGGEILFCLSRKAVMSEESATLRYYASCERTLQEIIQLPSGNVLLHFVKKEHDTFCVCDATHLAQRSNERVVDVEAFLKEIRMADMPERDKHPIIRRYSYDILNEGVLLPAYYLYFPEIGVPFSKFVKIESNPVLSDECVSEEKVVTINHLSTTFTKSSFTVVELPNLNSDRLRRYYRVNGPAVVLAVSEQDIAIGYTTECTSFLVPYNLYVLKPQAGIDTRYLASKLLSQSVRDQLIRLVYGKGISAKLVSNWSNFVLTELHSEEKQQTFIQETILKDFATQESYAAMQEKGFKHAIRLRKHALSQNISAFDSLFGSLEYCMKEHKGHLKAEDQLSPVSPMTVGEAISILRSDLDIICNRVTHLTDDQDWGACEAIEPQQFIENYEQEHRGTDFRFIHPWMDGIETNCFEKDIFDKATGKLLFHQGESMNAAWFPKKALQQVFDNIVSNAREHGFTDKSRNDYAIQSSWTTDGLNMLIKVSNNGTPLSADLDTNLVLEYGYTTALNQKGHGGIGGGEIAEIMHRYGGKVDVVSTPDKEFTVTYVLTIPLASIY